MDSKTRIPPTDRTEALVGKKSRDAAVKPFQRSCTPSEAAYVYLLALHRLGKHTFDQEAALSWLNSRRPPEIQEIQQATFDSMRRQPAIHEAMKRFEKYGRLPKACGRWRPSKVVVRKKAKVVQDPVAASTAYPNAVEPAPPPIPQVHLREWPEWRRSSCTQRRAPWWYSEFERDLDRS